jgi:hypothetical protein
MGEGSERASTFPASLEIPATGLAERLPKNRNARKLFLLPGGEGQVEGERYLSKQNIGTVLE